MRLVNLTPHTIRIRTASGSVVIPSSGVARVAQLSTKQVGELFVDADDQVVPFVAAPRYGAVEGLPVDSPGISYLVSALVLQAVVAAGGRADVFAPDTSPNGGAIRNAAGQIEAVTRLVQAAE